MTFMDILELLEAQPAGTILTHRDLYPVTKTGLGRWAGPHSERDLGADRFARILFEAYKRGEPWGLS